MVVMKKLERDSIKNSKKFNRDLKIEKLFLHPIFCAIYLHPKSIYIK